MAKSKLAIINKQLIDLYEQAKVLNDYIQNDSYKSISYSKFLDIKEKAKNVKKYFDSRAFPHQEYYLAELKTEYERLYNLFQVGQPIYNENYVIDYNSKIENIQKLFEESKAFEKTKETYISISNELKNNFVNIKENYNRLRTLLVSEIRTIESTNKILAELKRLSNAYAILTSYNSDMWNLYKLHYEPWANGNRKTVYKFPDWWNYYLSSGRDWKLGDVYE